MRENCGGNAGETAVENAGEMREKMSEKMREKLRKKCRRKCGDSYDRTLLNTFDKVNSEFFRELKLSFILEGSSTVRS